MKKAQKWKHNKTPADSIFDKPQWLLLEIESSHVQPFYRENSAITAILNNTVIT